MPTKVMFETALTDTWTSTEGDLIGDKPGDIRWEADSVGMKCYKCVIFNNGAGSVAAVVGFAAYYFGVSGDPAATGYDVHTVTMDRTDGYGTAAGIFLAIPADGDRCWVQIKGHATLIATALNVGANDGLAITETGAGIDGELDVSALVTDVVVGYVIDESAFTIICDFPF